jgi:hypothetical protein
VKTPEERRAQLEQEGPLFCGAGSRSSTASWRPIPAAMTGFDPELVASSYHPDGFHRDRQP